MAITITEGWNGPGSKDGKLTVVEPRDNALHPSDSKWSFEHWYFDARLDTGHTVVVFLQKRRPEEPPNSKPVVEVVVYFPDGTRRQIIKHYPRMAFEASAEKCQARVAHNTCELISTDPLPVHRVQVAEDGVEFDFTFTNELPSWMPGEGYTKYGDTDFFAWVVPAPRAKVTGTLSIDGQDIPVDGLGYADHNWGVGNMTRVIERWHWGRLYTDRFSLIYAMVGTQKRFDHHQSQPLMLAKDGEIILSTGELTLTEGPTAYNADARRSYPTWIRMETEASADGVTDAQVTLQMNVRDVIHGHDLLDDIPVVGTKIGGALLKPIIHKVVGQPGYFRFLSDFELTVTVDGETIVETGTTLHELVALT
ncbi:putative secreted hydrolase [Nocardioides sp. J9]|uniref:lipocalin-like domain-containing protein n=1 Tax=Nocardioides sp. J9 TaxID=935844 RepID=UPI00119D5455|nr:lipocalin-like domain-containing protein [Nocardioides sp. J9]TWH02713.1 putative secreted hydrolase [Nocardioides sp. J9]